jgi:ATP-dependent 26S proteasome regulatory subunit
MATSPFVADVLNAAKTGGKGSLSPKDLDALMHLLDEKERVSLAVQLYEIAIQNAGYKTQAEKFKEQLEAIFQAPARVGVLVELYELDGGIRRGLVAADGGLLDIPVAATDGLQVGDRVGIVTGQEGACLARSFGPYMGGTNATFQGREDGHLVLEGEHNEIIRAVIAPTVDQDSLEAGRTIVRVAVLGGLEAVALGIVAQPEQDGAGLLRKMPKGVTFADVAGLDPVVEQLAGKVTIWYDGDLARKYNLNQRRGVLLVGLPGTGKTVLTWAIASYAAELLGQDVPAFEISTGDVLSQWFGQSEKNIRRAAAAASRAGTAERPALCAMQDFEGLVYDRRRAQWSVTHRVTATMNEVLDDPERTWIPLATANCAEIADAATTNRWHIIEVRPPSESGVRKILALKLSDTVLGQSMDELCDTVIADMRRDLLKVTIAGQVRTFQNIDLMTGRRITKAVEAASEVSALRDREFGGRRFGGVTAADVTRALLAEFASLAKCIVPQTAGSHLPISLEESQQVSHVHVVRDETADVSGGTEFIRV